MSPIFFTADIPEFSSSEVLIIPKPVIFGYLMYAFWAL